MALLLSGNIPITLSELKPLIDAFVREKYGAPVTRIELHKDKVLAFIEHTVDEKEVKPIVAGSKTKGNKTKPKLKKKISEGFKHRWSGLYRAAGMVIEKQRKRKKSFISFDDLLAELLEMKDSGGNLLFVKGNEPLPMTVLKQRLSPSQVERQSKTQRNLEGITHEQTGLKI